MVSLVRVLRPLCIQSSLGQQRKFIANIYTWIAKMLATAAQHSTNSFGQQQIHTTSMFSARPWWKYKPMMPMQWNIWIPPLNNGAGMCLTQKLVMTITQQTLWRASMHAPSLIKIFMCLHYLKVCVFFCCCFIVFSSLVASLCFHSWTT